MSLAGRPRETSSSPASTRGGTFPDITLTPEGIVADADGAAFRFRFEGTHDGEFQGIEPTGEHLEISEMIFFEIGDDRIDGLWFEWDELGFYERLGVLEHPVR